MPLVAANIVTNEPNSTKLYLTEAALKKQGIPAHITTSVHLDTESPYTIIDEGFEYLGRNRNIGAEQVIERYDPIYILFIDDDILLSKKWLDSFISVVDSCDPEIYHTRLLLPNGGRCWDYCSINPHMMCNYDQQRPNWYITGGYWCVKSNLWDQHKWDDNIPMYAMLKDKGALNEDVEYSLRLAKNGLVPTFDVNNLAWHFDNRYKQVQSITVNTHNCLGYYCPEFIKSLMYICGE